MAAYIVAKRKMEAWEMKQAERKARQQNKRH